VNDNEDNVQLKEIILNPNDYNPKEFNISPKAARFFVIKSYSEDDVHRSIKYNIWCSTEHGNRRLDSAYLKGLQPTSPSETDTGSLTSVPSSNNVPVYLFFSVNGSGHFCGMAEMISRVDYNKKTDVWSQDKWRGCFQVRWIYVKDIPNSLLRNIRLENNDNKPVTNSRDTQEIPFDKGRQVLKVFHTYNHTSSIFDDFDHYEKRQDQDILKNVNDEIANGYNNDNNIIINDNINYIQGNESNSLSSELALNNNNNNNDNVLNKNYSNEFENDKNKSKLIIERENLKLTSTKNSDTSSSTSSSSSSSSSSTSVDGETKEELIQKEKAKQQQQQQMQQPKLVVTS